MTIFCHGNFSDLNILKLNTTSEYYLGEIVIYIDITVEINRFTTINLKLFVYGFCSIPKSFL